MTATDSEEGVRSHAIPVGMLFIPCRAGISPSPEEFISPTQIALGASVLAQAMLLAGNRYSPFPTSVMTTAHLLFAVVTTWLESSYVCAYKIESGQQ